MVFPPTKDVVRNLKKIGIGEGFVGAHMKSDTRKDLENTVWGRKSTEKQGTT
jgi:hypothetical protein